MSGYHAVTRRITELLARRGVWFETFEHEAVRTSEEAAQVRAGYAQSDGAKAILLGVKQKGEQRRFVMLVFPADKRFDKKRVIKLFGTRDFRFASREEVARLTGDVLPGAIPPFGHLFELPVFADERLFKNTRMVFNAGDRRFSVAMHTADYRTIENPTVALIAQD